MQSYTSYAGFEKAVKWQELEHTQVMTKIA